MSGTLIFCTSYADTDRAWRRRYRLWINAIRGGGIDHGHVLLVDDGSPLLPDWPDVSIQPATASSLSPLGVTLARFSLSLGRQAIAVYPGWYRSFCFAARFAERHGFDKVVHVESDGFIISARMQDYINDFADGWVAPSILSHDMPESAIQIMAGDGFERFAGFTRRSYADLVGLEAEHFLPFTHIERGFVGSRYGETLREVPRNADFVTQTHPEHLGDAGYLWWLDPALIPG